MTKKKRSNIIIALMLTAALLSATFVTVFAEPQAVTQE